MSSRPASPAPADYYREAAKTQRERATATLTTELRDELIQLAEIYERLAAFVEIGRSAEI